MRPRIFHAIILAVITIVVVAVFLTAAALLKKVLPGWLFLTLQVLWCVFCLAYIFYTVEKWTKKKVEVKTEKLVFLNCTPKDLYPKEVERNGEKYKVMPAHYIRCLDGENGPILIVSLEEMEDTKDGIYFEEHSVRIPKDEA